MTRILTLKVSFLLFLPKEFNPLPLAEQLSNISEKLRLFLYLTVTSPSVFGNNPGQFYRTARKDGKRLIGVVRMEILGKCLLSKIEDNKVSKI